MQNAVELLKVLFLQRESRFSHDVVGIVKRKCHENLKSFHINFHRVKASESFHIRTRQKITIMRNVPKSSVNIAILSRESLDQQTKKLHGQLAMQTIRLNKVVKISVDRVLCFL
jgi:hypothetical protein